MYRTVTTFGLLEKPGSFGLDCGPDGLTLAGVPLLKRDEHGFSPRSPQELHDPERQARTTCEKYASTEPTMPVASLWR